MKIFIASDHAGFALKTFLIKSPGPYEWEDLGAFNDQKSSYSEQGAVLCHRLLKNDTDGFGVLICASGQGMAMMANRFLGVRASLCWNKESTHLARAHNNANVLCLGARWLSEPLAQDILDTFVNTPFEGGRHKERLALLDAPK